MRLNLPQNKKPCTSHLVMGQVKCDIRALDFSFVTFPPRHLIGQQLERGKFARAKPSDADSPTRSKCRRQEVVRFHTYIIQHSH